MSKLVQFGFAIILWGILVLSAMGVDHDRKFYSLMAARAIVPVEIVVPTLWTQCQVIGDGVIRCETAEPDAWKAAKGGTVL